MDLHTKSIPELRKSLARKQELIAKCRLDAQACDERTDVGRASKRYYLGRAGYEQEQKEQIETELKRRGV